jgi:3D (Asp-Asp-Asp) domain-containing protein
MNYYLLLALTTLSTTLIITTTVPEYAVADVNVPKPSLEVQIEPLEGVLLPNQTIYAYTSRVQETDDTPYTTANGTTVRSGIIANNCYGFGTEVRIETPNGIRHYEVHDRMNSRYDCNVWDIWMDDLQEARNWGKRELSVEVLTD